MVPKIYLDTNVFIEAYERIDFGHSPIWSVLNAVERGDLRAVTSEITLAELLPKLISDGETQLIALYEQLFSEASLIDVMPITREFLVESAHRRAARRSLTLPDAIHLATAGISNCRVIVSNDQRLASISTLPVVPVGADCLSRIRSLAS